MTNPFKLTGKTALVTGGNGGIGLGIARGLAQAGASVAVVGRNQEKIASALADLSSVGNGTLGVQADVTDPAQVQRMVAETAERFGGVDILVANAGTNIRKTPDSYSLGE